MGAASPSPSPRKKARASRRVLSEINVTPFVDVMLVLLVIFMVTAPMMQQGLDVNLPETQAGAAAVSKNPFILTIKKPGRIFIQNNIEVPVDELLKKLSAVLAVREDKHIYIQADKSIRYDLVARTLAVLQAGGWTKISLITTVK